MVINPDYTIWTPQEAEELQDWIFDEEVTAELSKIELEAASTVSETSKPPVND